MSKRVLDVKATKRNLRQLRQSLKMTQFEVSCEIGYEQSAVNRWEGENNSCLPKLDGLVALAEVYGVEPGDLIIMTAGKE